MCFVCEKNGRTFEMLKPFLKEDVEIKFKSFEDGWQKIWLRQGSENIVITADGDHGGYFHFSDEVKETEDMEPEEEILLENLDRPVMSSSKQWSIDSTLSVMDINKLLPGVANQKNKFSGDGKSSNEWFFKYKGKECNIWDYKGARWSGYGPRWVFEELGFRIES